MLAAAFAEWPCAAAQEAKQLEEASLASSLPVHCLMLLHQHRWLLLSRYLRQFQGTNHTEADTWMHKGCKLLAGSQATSAGIPINTYLPGAWKIQE